MTIQQFCCRVTTPSLENLWGKTGRTKTGLTGNMGTPRLLVLD
jgi:hypothetical protein